MARPKRTSPDRNTQPYKHPEADSPMRPDVGTQAQFRAWKPEDIPPLLSAALAEWDQRQETER